MPQSSSAQRLGSTSYQASQSWNQKVWKEPKVAHQDQPLLVKKNLTTNLIMDLIIQLTYEVVE